MQRLTVSHHHVVGDINDIIDRTQTDDGQFVLQPFWRLLHLAAGDAHTGIALAGLAVLDGYVDIQVVVINRKSIACWTMQRCLHSTSLHPGIQITSHTIVRQRIRAVGGNVNLYHPVAFQMIVFSRRLTHRSVFRQYDDTVVRGTHTDFVFCANHTQRLNAAQLRFLDLELLVAVIEHTTQIGNDHLLTSCHIGSATHNLLWFALTQVNGCHMQVVAVGMCLTGEHLAHIQSFQSSFNCLYFF